MSVGGTGQPATPQELGECSFCRSQCGQDLADSTAAVAAELAAALKQEAWLEEQWGKDCERLAATREALEQIAEPPLCDDTFRARLLRQGLSNEEMRQYVESAEALQAAARAALAGSVADAK